MNGAVVAAVAAFNFAVLAGCAYLVTVHGWSAWWFLLAILCLGSVKSTRNRSA